MRDWLIVVIVGAALGLTSYWHHGAGTSGRAGPIVLLVAAVALTGAAWMFRG